MDVAAREKTWGADAVDEELVRLIERRARKGEVDPDEQEEAWKESVRRHNARLQEENRLAWCEYHEGQAARHRAVLEELIARHQAEAERYREPEET